MNVNYEIMTNNCHFLNFLLVRAPRFGSESSSANDSEFVGRVILLFLSTGRLLGGFGGFEFEVCKTKS